MVLGRRKFFNEFVLTYGKTTYCTHNTINSFTLTHKNNEFYRPRRASFQAFRECTASINATLLLIRDSSFFGSIELAMRKITTHRHPFVTKNSSKFSFFFALKNLTSLPLSILEEGFIQFLQRKFQLHFLSIFSFFLFF